MSAANEFMRAARGRLDISKSELGRRLGLSRFSIHRYEQDGYVVPPHVQLATQRLLDEQRRKKL